MILETEDEYLSVVPDSRVTLVFAQRLASHRGGSKNESPLGKTNLVSLQLSKLITIISEFTRNQLSLCKVPARPPIITCNPSHLRNPLPLSICSLFLQAFPVISQHHLKTWDLIAPKATFGQITYLRLISIRFHVSIQTDEHPSCRPYIISTLEQKVVSKRCTSGAANDPTANDPRARYSHVRERYCYFFLMGCSGHDRGYLRILGPYLVLRTAGQMILYPGLALGIGMLRRRSLRTTWTRISQVEPTARP